MSKAGLVQAVYWAVDDAAVSHVLLVGCAAEAGVCVEALCEGDHTEAGNPAL